VNTGIADDFEMRRVARLAQHRSGIAADRLRLTRFKQVVIVENETVGLLRDGAEIMGHLPEILAAVLEVELEGGIDPDLLHRMPEALRRSRGILERRPGGHQRFRRPAAGAARCTTTWAGPCTTRATMPTSPTMTSAMMTRAWPRCER